MQAYIQINIKMWKVQYNKHFRLPASLKWSVTIFFFGNLITLLLRNNSVVLHSELIGSNSKIPYLGALMTISRSLLCSFSVSLAGVNFYIIKSCWTQTKTSLSLNSSGKLIQFWTLSWASFWGENRRVLGGIQILSWLVPKAASSISLFSAFRNCLISSYPNAPWLNYVALAVLELCLDQAGLELKESHLSLLPNCWD